MSDAKSPPVPSMDEILATVRRIIGDDERPPRAPLTGGRSRAAAGDAAVDDDDILELTEAINEDGSTRHLAPAGAAARREPGFRGPPPVAPRPEAVPQAQPALGDRTIEDVVRELLRPLLQTWLDENLPEIIERLARAEIARAVDKSGGG